MSYPHPTNTPQTLQQLCDAHYRKQLHWLLILALPLVLPIAIPGMATTVGVISLLVAWKLTRTTRLELPTKLTQRRIPNIATNVITKLEPLHQFLSKQCRPRYIKLSNHGTKRLNAFFVAGAGLSMMAPIPLIPFDNILPAVALSILTLGLLRRDGLFLAIGYLLTLLAWIYVIFIYKVGVEGVSAAFKVVL